LPSDEKWRKWGIQERVRAAVAFIYPAVMRAGNESCFIHKEKEGRGKSPNPKWYYLNLIVALQALNF
jgi:hypothetical protein